ncbi:hypothetical protein [Alkalilacustris brevis]|nr:hypothetical protein [Alkalilacustris brevis]
MLDPLANRPPSNSGGRTSGDAEVTAEAAFTAPRPEQPYPSWE